MAFYCVVTCVRHTFPPLWWLPRAMLGILLLTYSFRLIVESQKGVIADQ